MLKKSFSYKQQPFQAVYCVYPACTPAARQYHVIVYCKLTDKYLKLSTYIQLRVRDCLKHVFEHAQGLGGPLNLSQS